MLYGNWTVISCTAFMKHFELCTQMTSQCSASGCFAKLLAHSSLFASSPGPIWMCNISCFLLQGGHSDDILSYDAVCYAALGVQEGLVNRHRCRPICRIDVISLLSDESIGAQIPTSGIPMLWDGDYWLHAVVCFSAIGSKLYPGSRVL